MASNDKDLNASVLKQHNRRLVEATKVEEKLVVLKKMLEHGDR